MTEKKRTNNNRLVEERLRLPLDFEEALADLLQVKPIESAELVKARQAMNKKARTAESKQTVKKKS
ncbi:MAG: hypothetical protein WBD27_08090 [Pyrinomonadaceae bacterium]